MKIEEAKLDLIVVRSKGDYVVGRTGRIVDIDEDNRRVRVAWEGFNKTWVKVECVELHSIPYRIEFSAHSRNLYPQYVKL